MGNFFTFYKTKVSLTTQPALTWSCSAQNYVHHI